MKNLLFIVFLLCAVISVNGQREEYTWDYITFEEPYRYLEIDTAASNIWEIGTPAKQWFNNSFAGLNSIYTGGGPSYPMNNHSTFTLTINWLNVDHYPYSVYLEFMHRVDTEKGMDGGYIDVSYDGGASWTNIIEDRSACICPGDQWESEGLYTTDETLFNGEYGFSGDIYSWTKVRFGWEYCLAKSSPEVSDSMLLRFHFISDGTDTSREGWNIDHIRLFSMPLTGSAGNKQSPGVSVMPNPATNQVQVVPLDGSPVERLTLFDMTGNLLEVVELSGYLSLAAHPPGMYFLKIEAASGKVFRKILKQ